MNATVIIDRLRHLGNGDPAAGYRLLCAMSMVCSFCGDKWDADGRCRCIP